MSKYLIINADDFGLTSGVNQGIMEAHVDGIVTSASIMANTPGFEEAVRLARKTPSLSVGFHFNLTYGFPLSDPKEIPSLVDMSGRFNRVPAADSPKWTRADIIKELDAQWHRLLEAKLAITHIDSHHYIQGIPDVYEGLAALAKKHRLPMRHTFPRQHLPSLHSSALFNGIHSDKAWLHPQHPATTDYFISDIYFNEDGWERLLCHLKNLRPGTTELNCHPGHADEALKALSPWLDEREAELKVFKDPQMRSWLMDLDITLMNYAALTP